MQKGPLATIGGGPFSISYNPIDSGFRHHVDLDARRDVLVHTDRCRVNTDETNILVNGNIAAVDLESTLGQFHRNLLRGHGTEDAVLLANLDHDRNLDFLEFALLSHGPLASLCTFASGLTYFLFVLPDPARCSKYGDAARNEVVAAEAVLHADDLAGGAELFVVLLENDFHINIGWITVGRPGLPYDLLDERQQGEQTRALDRTAELALKLRRDAGYAPGKQLALLVNEPLE